MFKLLAPAALCIVMFIPNFAQSQDCGCNDNFDPCVKTRKKLALVNTAVDIKRLRRVCETDACGCPSKRLRLTCETVSFKRLALVDVAVDPCRPKLFSRLRNGLGRSGGSFDGCEGGCGGGSILGGNCGVDGGSMNYSLPQEGGMIINEPGQPAMGQPMDGYYTPETTPRTMPRTAPRTFEAPITLEGN